MRKMLNEWKKFLDEGFGDVPPETLAKVATQKKDIARVKELALEGEILAKGIDKMDPKKLYFLIVGHHDNVVGAEEDVAALKSALKSGNEEGIERIRNDIQTEQDRTDTEMKGRDAEAARLGYRRRSPHN